MMTSIKKTLNPLKNLLKATLTYADEGGYYGLSRAEYYEWYLNQRKRLAQFKKLHRRESCFIIGNGPSLNKMDLSPLRDYHTFGLNKIYLMFDKVDLNLSYHVSVNSLVIEQSLEQFKGLSCRSFLSYRAFCHYKQKRNLLQKQSVPANIYFIKTKNSCNFEPDLPQVVSEGYTVTYVALQIAFYMGFKQVFLIGVDHNFAAVGNPNETQLLTGEDMNHFSPDYFANQQWQLPDLEGSELSYRIAKLNFERAGRKIYDATVGGKLTIFPKIAYEEALQMCHKK